MLLTSFHKRIFRPECNPSFQSVHCVAELDQDVGEVLPYLNSVLGGSAYLKDPPSLTLRVYGKLITIHSRKIAINALKDEQEADKILLWLTGEINKTWEGRASIEPSFEARPAPGMLEILKLLPRTNCRQCGEPTCMVFAVKVADGAADASDCPPIAANDKEDLEQYLSQFKFDL